MNYLHKWHLIEAEKQRVLGNRAAAIDHYDRAIELAKEHLFVHEEALANELATKFYSRLGQISDRPNLCDRGILLLWTLGCYRQGQSAHRTVSTATGIDLECAQQHGSPRKIPSIVPTSTRRLYSNRSLVPLDILDLPTLLRASQTISEQIRLDRLIAKFLEIVIANAGADKCVLLLKQAENLQVVARVELGQQPQLVEPIPFALSTDIATILVNKVLHDLTPILLLDAPDRELCAADRYLAKYQPKSILCTPILDRGELVGILYIENQLTVGAFTRDRLDMLKVIISQAAISIVNAQLYSDLQVSFTDVEQKVVERTLELKAAKELADRAKRIQN